MVGATALESRPAEKPVLAFRQVGQDQFIFNTGVLMGKLAGDGRAKGLSSLVHAPTGTRLDSSMGLLSHYRVFTTGKRYGVAAWDWAAQYDLRPDGAVQLRWPPKSGRPFELRAVYRLSAPDTIDLETSVTAESNLQGFESFVANYFSPGFTNAGAYVRNLPGKGSPGFLAAEERLGFWQTFPRDAAAAEVYQDGRWKLEPHPVDWKPVAEFAAPLAFRRSQVNGLATVLMSDPQECFAISMPHQAEGHYSVYFSLFGRDLRKGETAKARTRLQVVPGFRDAEALRLLQTFTRN